MINGVSKKIKEIQKYPFSLQNIGIIILIIISVLLNTTYSYQLGTLQNLLSNNTLLDKNSFEEFSQKLLNEGRMADCCLTYKEYLDLVSDLEKSYPHLLETFSIGQTYNNNSLVGIRLKPKYRANKAILFTGMHHGREPVSMMMNVYILLKLIHLREYSISPQNMTKNMNFPSEELLDHVNIYFLPVINVDWYILNNHLYTQGSRSFMVRKNRRSSKEEFKCNEDFEQSTVGVDLNRN